MLVGPSAQRKVGCGWSSAVSNEELREAIRRIYSAPVYEGGKLENGISLALVAAISDAAKAAGLNPKW